MTDTYCLKRLFRRLKPDVWRSRTPFSEDMSTAQDVLFHTRATDGQKAEALSLWLQHHQPCLFGRIAAATGMLHYCVLNEEDLRESDQHVAEKIQHERLAWKQRSLRPDPGFSQPAHGFVLAVASSTVALATPDENLYQFACKIRDLWGCPSSEENSGMMHWETLFLQNPQDSSYVRFTFGVDFFASQGDHRWWHDHRVPGGLAFTANSVGHMQRYREWYKGSKNQREWVLQTAMGTIHLSAHTPHGKATWLRPLSGGRPVIADIQCPFANPDKLKPELKGMDWTRYGGHLHTDHSIRKEFFSEKPGKTPDLTNSEWLQDFTYLYDGRKKDHVRFMVGQIVSYDEVVVELGTLEDIQRIVSPRAKRALQSPKDHDEIESLLEKCRQWRRAPEELESS
jgi:hypothetical protein